MQQNLHMSSLQNSAQNQYAPGSKTIDTAASIEQLLIQLVLLWYYNATQN